MKRLALLFCALLFLPPLLLGLLNDEIARFPLPFGRIDFSQYWVAGRLLLAGENPYSPELLWEIQKSKLPELDEPIRIWNPPLLFPLILPFAMIPFEEAYRAFFISGLLSFIVGTLMLLHERNREWNRHFPFVALFFATYFPLFHALSFGQSSWILFCGMILFLFSRPWLLSPPGSQSETSKSSPLGGIGLALTLCKPHLLLLYYPFWVLHDLSHKRYRSIAAFLLCAVTLAVLPLLFREQVWFDYLRAMQHPPLVWKTSSAGSYLQGALNFPHPIIRLTPILVAYLGMLILLMRGAISVRNSSWWTHGTLISLSILLSPYGWSFDTLLLFPFWLSLFLDTTPRWRIAILAIHLAGMLVSLAKFGLEYFIWYPALLTLLLILRSTKSDFAHRP
ncbi:glycosyltransferase 87 family protein [bacterium]|nr:glycosyltransferase 87 family protein [bacterium]